MADVFISYARSDLVRVQALAAALTALGWTVWRDDQISTGTPYDLVIDQQLDTAACVLVVWSSASVASDWVRAEASAADEQGKLLPVTFERNLRAPVRFRQLHVAYLTSTDLTERTPDVMALLADIAGRTGKVPNQVDPILFDRARARRSSGAFLVTAGEWLITVRVAGVRARYQLTLHPTGSVTGTGKFAISRATLAGRWTFDPAKQLLLLELSGGIAKGTQMLPVQITQWTSPHTAECRFEHRRAVIERDLLGG